MVSASSLSETTGFRLLVATAEHIFFLHLCFFVFLTINHLSKDSGCFSISCSSSRLQIKDSGLIAVNLSFRQSALEEIIIIKETLPFNFCFQAWFSLFILSSTCLGSTNARGIRSSGSNNVHIIRLWVLNSNFPTSILCLFLWESLLGFQIINRNWRKGWRSDGVKSFHHYDLEIIDILQVKNENYYSL